MNTKLLLWICGVVLLFGSCREEFDDHYNKVNDASIGMSVTQVLENKGGFELFLQMIRRADLERTLSQSGLYTCFAPKDEDVQKWLDENGWTVANMPERKMIDFINYHFMLGMVYYYDLEKYYEYSDDWDKTPSQYALGVKKDTRTSGKAHPSKHIRLFTSSYLSVRGDDYRKMMGVEPGDFMVENVPVSVTDRDIPTSNGVVHVLDGPLMLAPRMDEAIAADPQLSVINKWFDRFSGYTTVGIENDKVDTTLIKFYNVTEKTGSGQSLNIADEDFFNTAFLPTDEAMRTFFEPYFTPDLLVSFDSVPNELVVPFLKAIVSANTPYVWGLSDIARNMPYWRSYAGDFLTLKNDIASMYVGAIFSSNSMIYKINKVPDIPLFTSVKAVYLIKNIRYKEWAKLIERKSVVTDGWFGVDNSYQHSSRIVLIQADDSKAWDNGEGEEKGIDGYEPEYLDTLVMRLNAGVLMADLNEGQFEHRYYPGAFGDILCEVESGTPVFKDFKGKEVHLTSPEAAWVADNGALFEVDGIFNHLLNTDSTELLFRKYIAKDDDLSTFKTLIEKADRVDLLDKTGVIRYTVFAPTNDAFSNSNINVATMEEEEAAKLLTKCIVSGSRLYTDGFSEGVITMMDGSTRLLKGSWENCILETSRANRANIILEKSNRQGSNGVLHVVDKLLEI